MNSKIGFEDLPGLLEPIYADKSSLSFTRSSELGKSLEESGVQPRFLGPIIENITERTYQAGYSRAPALTPGLVLICKYTELKLLKLNSSEWPNPKLRDQLCDLASISGAVDELRKTRLDLDLNAEGLIAMPSPAQDIVALAFDTLSSRLAQEIDRPDRVDKLYQFHREFPGAVMRGLPKRYGWDL